MGGELADRLRLIEDYLLPLKLVDGRYPVAEHARIAAEIIRANGLAGGLPPAGGASAPA